MLVSFLRVVQSSVGSVRGRSKLPLFCPLLGLRAGSLWNSFGGCCPWATLDA